jgi:hypothetical protein
VTLAFDSGLARSRRELILEAVAAKLAPLKRPTKYLAAVVSLPRAEQDEDLLADIARAANGRTPLVAIAMGGKDPEGSGQERTQNHGEYEFTIYVLSSNQAGVTVGRLLVDERALADDTKDPGVFAMLEHIEERVWGASLGIAGIEEPIQVKEDELATFDDATIWFQRYTVGAHIAINPDRDATQVIDTIEAQHQGDGITPTSSLDPFITKVTALDPEAP